MMVSTRIVRSVVAGAAAAFAASTVGTWLPAIGLARIDYALWNGNLLVPDTTAVSFAWVVGIVQTVGLSAAAALVYASSLRGRLPGPSAVRGALWGIATVLLSGLIAMPLLFGAGVLGRGWDPALPVSLVLCHLVWGATLGIVYDLE